MFRRFFRELFSHYSSEPRCRIDEEWCGYFIGRRWCATHEVYWDNGGPCPMAVSDRG